MTPALGLFFAITLATQPPPHRIAAKVYGSLEATLVKAAPRDGAALAAQVARLLRWRGDVVRNVHPRDDLAVLYVYETNEIQGRTETTPELVALRYRGLQLNLRAYRFSGHDQVARYFDETGALVEPWLLDSPVDSYVQITERMQRGRGKRRHDGLDLKAATGVPVKAPWPGRVSRVNWLVRLNGKCVEVVYANGNRARFLHLSEVTEGLAPGDAIAAHTRIGAVGSSGRSGAPHLHYEILGRNGRPRDPLVVHGTKRLLLEGSARDAFDVVRSGYDELLAGRSTGGAGGRPRTATSAACAPHAEADPSGVCEP